MRMIQSFHLSQGRQSSGQPPSVRLSIQRWQHRTLPVARCRQIGGSLIFTSSFQLDRLHRELRFGVTRGNTSRVKRSRTTGAALDTTQKDSAIRCSDNASSLNGLRFTTFTEADVSRR
jgi:hypothetical protein